MKGANSQKGPSTASGKTQPENERQRNPLALNLGAMPNKADSQHGSKNGLHSQTSLTPSY
jgi:hypothetical protein